MDRKQENCLSSKQPRPDHRYGAFVVSGRRTLMPFTRGMDEPTWYAKLWQKVKQITRRNA